MRRKLAALILIGIIAAACLYAAASSRSVLAMAEGSLAGELTKSFGSAVQIADVQIDSFHSLTLHNISIYDKQGRLAASATIAQVTFSLFDVIRGRKGIDAVSEVVLVSPQLKLVQAADGKWNIEDIFEHQDKDRINFNGKIRLEDAVVAMKTSLGDWQASAITGSLDFGANPWITVKLAGRYRERPVSVTGKIKSSFDGTVTLRADQLDLTDFSSLLPVSAGCKLLEGRLERLDVTFHKEKDSLSAAGEAKADGVSLDLGGYHLRQGKGFVTFTDQFMYFFGAAAQLNAEPVELSGKMTYSGSEPVFDMKVSSPGFEPAALWPQSPLHGKVAVAADVKGSFTHPLINAELSMSVGDYNGRTITNGKAQVRLNGQQLTIANLSAGVFGGIVQATGMADIGNEQYQLQVQGNGLSAASLNAVSGLDGAVAFHAAVSGQGSLTSAFINGDVSIDSGSWRGIAFENAQAGFHKTPTQIELNYLAIKAGGGSLTGQGSLQDDTLRAHLLGHDLPLAALNQLLPGESFSGRVHFEGDLSGTLDNPEFIARFRAENGSAYHQSFQQASGGLVISSAALRLNGVEVQDRNSRHKLQGTIGLSGKRLIDLAITTSQARAEDLIRLLAPGEQLTGNIDNTVIISGSVDKPVVAGRFKLTEGSYRGYLIASAEGSYDQTGGITHIRDVVVSSLNAQIRLAGTIGAERDMNIDIAAKDVDLARLHISYPYPVSGLANFTGQLAGTMDHPIFSGEFSASSLKLNGQAMNRVSGSLNIDGSQVSIPAFGFEQGAGRYSFSGSLDLDGQKLFGVLDVENAELAPLLAVLNVPVSNVEGKLNGRITVNGPMKRPNVWLTGSLSAGKLKGYPLDSIDIDVELANNIITVNQFLAKQGAGILAIQGTANLDGDVNLEVGGRDIDAGLLTVWFDSKLDTRGKLNFAAQMTGTAKNPHTAVSLEIKGGGVSNATFDSLYGLFVVDKGTIHVNQLMLSKGNYRASAYGLIPLAALNKEGRQNATIADQMDLHVRLDQADLSILPLLTPEVTAASGKTEGEMLISGTLAQPYIHGSIRVDGGMVKLRALNDPIQKLMVDIQFEGDTIVVKSFDGQSGGGSFRLAGSAALKGLSLVDYQALLSLDKIGINHKYFKGPLTGTLTLNQAGTMPKLSGKLLFENDVIDIPYIPEIKASGVNFALDLELQAGKRVRFYNAYMYDLMASGRVKFAGTVKHPDVSGRIEATRGTVNYLRTQFKISEGRADFTQFGSFEPVITLNADAKLEKTTVNLKVYGPVSAMDLKLTSEPSMSQQEILSLLTLRSRYFDKQKSGDSIARDTSLSRDEVVSLLDAGLQMRFVSELEESFRRAFGLDGFKLVRGTLSEPIPASTPGKTTAGGDSAQDREITGDREVYNVEVSKYVTDRLMLSYTFGIDHKAYSAGFRYDLTRRISLTGSVDEYNRSRLGLETRFRF